MVYILMATYNGEGYIQKQIDSVIHQTYQEWKLLVHDDGSTDRTLEIVREFDDKRISILEDGVVFGSSTGNFLHLTRYVGAEATYFCFCDQDDLWAPEKIEVQLSTIAKFEDHGVPICVYSDLSLIDEKDSLIHASFWRYSSINSRPSFMFLFLENSLTGCTMMMNRKVLDYLRGVSHMDVVQHDWLIGLICASDGVLEPISKPLVNYRQHTRNEVGARRQQIAEHLLSRGVVSRLRKIFKLRGKIIKQLREVRESVVNPASKRVISRYVEKLWLYKPVFIGQGLYRSKTVIGSIAKVILY